MRRDELQCTGVAVLSRLTVAEEELGDEFGRMRVFRRDANRMAVVVVQSVHRVEQPSVQQTVGPLIGTRQSAASRQCAHGAERAVVSSHKGQML